jgi:hypothetical protein
MRPRHFVIKTPQWCQRRRPAASSRSIPMTTGTPIWGQSRGLQPAEKRCQYSSRSALRSRQSRAGSARVAVVTRTARRFASHRAKMSINTHRRPSVCTRTVVYTEGCYPDPDACTTAIVGTFGDGLVRRIPRWSPYPYPRMLSPGSPSSVRMGLPYTRLEAAFGAHAPYTTSCRSPGSRH